MLKKLPILLFVSLLFLGCEQKHFSHTYDKKEIGTTVKNISIEHKETNSSINIKTKLKHLNFNIKQKSPYSIEIDSRLYPKRCNNPLATAEQKSYIGFVQLTLFKNKNKIYMCQSDFREKEEIPKIANGLVDILVGEMKIKN